MAFARRVLPLAQVARARAHSTSTAAIGRPSIGYLFSADERDRCRSLNEMFALEPPFQTFAARMGEGLGPLLESIRESEMSNQACRQAKSNELYVPSIPHLLPVARWARNNAMVRDVLVYDDAAVEVKPRLSWYHPDDRMVPRNWFQEGLAADFAHYYKDTMALSDAPPVTTN